MKVCRFNSKHKVPKKDFAAHEASCPDRAKRKDLKVCPYNSDHLLYLSQFDKHVAKCPDKPKEEEKLVNNSVQNEIRK